MNAKYTPAKVREYLDAVKQLHDENLDREENDRLTQAEQALYDEGWRNDESKKNCNRLQTKPQPINHRSHLDPTTHQTRPGATAKGRPRPGSAHCSSPVP